MVQYAVGSNKTPPDRYFIGKPYRFAIEVGNFPARFGTDKHPGGSICYSECPPEIDKTINSAAPDITEFKR
jgi:hypothetical protein